MKLELSDGLSNNSDFSNDSHSSQLSDYVVSRDDASPTTQTSTTLITPTTVSFNMY